MTKHLVDIDDDLLAAARRAMGTKGLKDTVQAALGTVAAAQPDRDAEVDAAFAALGRMDLSDAERAQAWR